MGAAVIILLAVGFLVIFQPWEKAFESNDTNVRGNDEPNGNNKWMPDNREEDVDLEVDPPKEPTEV